MVRNVARQHFGQYRDNYFSWVIPCLRADTAHTQLRSATVGCIGRGLQQLPNKPLQLAPVMVDSYRKETQCCWAEQIQETSTHCRSASSAKALYP